MSESNLTSRQKRILAAGFRPLHAGYKDGFRRLTTGFCLLVIAVAANASWPEFRGPGGTGISSSTNLPLHWGENKNVQWKTPIHGRGWSSPVTLGGEIWLTTATTNGHELSVISVDAETGKITRDLKLFDVPAPQYCHPFNSYASPTPVVEASRGYDTLAAASTKGAHIGERAQPGRVYVTFGAAGTTCLDSETGKVIWSRRDLECNHFRGPGSSLIVWSNLLFLNFDGSDVQYVVALDKASGKTVWKKDRSIDFKDADAAGKPQMDGDYRKAFATCLVIRNPEPILLSQGSKAFYAYEPFSGKELWRIEERSFYSGSGKPLFANGIVFFTAGFSSGEVLAIRPGKAGEVLDARTTNGPPGTQLSVVWRSKRNASRKPSLLLTGNLLFGVDDNGTATCWNARTGEAFWSEKLSGHYSASPIGSSNHVYFFSEEGKTTVVRSSRSFEKVAENELGDGFMATPAAVHDSLILRSRSHLYLIREAGFR